MKKSIIAVLAILNVIYFLNLSALAEQKEDPMQKPDAGKYQMAAFGAGCFWGIEYAFAHVKGVVSATSGYMGGHVANPTYRQVCTDTTGHAESVQVIYDPQFVTYEQLLKTFWEIHDPTQLNYQGPDEGTQYRSVIFYYTSEQQKAAQASKEALDKSGEYDEPVVTEIVPASDFYPAEEYHQKYYEKKGMQPVCIIPKKKKQ